MKNMIISGLLLGCISLMACKKEPIDKNAVAAKLIAGEWKYVRFGEEEPIGSPEQVMNFATPELHNYYADGTLSVTKQGSVYNDKWKILDEGKMLHFENSTGNYHLIRKLDGDSLIYYRDFEMNNMVVRRTFYYSK